MDTLREYEEQERVSPAVTPASPCSSEELNTPLLKRIAKRLFKANQESAAQTPPEAGTNPQTPDLELEISNDGLTRKEERLCRKASPAKTVSRSGTPNKKVDSSKSSLKNSQSSLKSTPLKSVGNLQEAQKKTPKATTGSGKPAAKVKRLELQRSSKASVATSNNQRKITDFFGLC